MGKRKVKKKNFNEKFYKQKAKLSTGNVDNFFLDRKRRQGLRKCDHKMWIDVCG
jgi:hypothetical protein